MRRIIATLGATLALLVGWTLPAQATTQHIGTVTAPSQCANGDCVSFSLFLFYDDAARVVAGSLSIRCSHNSVAQQCSDALGLNVYLHRTDTSGGSDVVVASHTNGACGADFGHTPCPGTVVAFSTNQWPLAGGKLGWYVVANATTVCYGAGGCAYTFGNLVGPNVLL